MPAKRPPLSLTPRRVRPRVLIIRPLIAALLAGLCACGPSATPPAPVTTLQPTTASLLVNAAAVDAKRLASREPDQWLTSAGDSTGTYYSPLKDIDAGNVAQLGFAWDYRLGTNRGQESTPLVIDGVMYATSNFGRVYALDAATRQGTVDSTIRASTGSGRAMPVAMPSTAVLAAFDGRLYVGALDGWLHALDARTGHMLWKVDTMVGRPCAQARIRCPAYRCWPAI